MSAPVTVDVLVLSCGKTPKHRALTVQCLDSLRAQRTRHRVRIIVAESHRGEDLSPHYLAPFRDADAARSCRLIPSPLPFSFNQTVQTGLAAMDRDPPADRGPNDAVLISNNDVTYAADCLERLVAALGQVDSVSPWMPGFHDPLHEPLQAGAGDSTVDLIRGYEVSRHLAGWSYAFNRRILGRNEWLTPEGLFPAKLKFWYQDDFYADVLQQNGLVHALVPSANAVHAYQSSHDLLPNQERATYGMKPTYEKLRERLRSGKTPQRTTGFWNWLPRRWAA